MQGKPAIARLGPVGADAEGHDLPGFGRRHRRDDRIPEGGIVRDNMIRRCHQHQRTGFSGVQFQGPGQDRGRGVAPFWLDQRGGGTGLGPGQLLGHHEAVIGGGDHRRRGKARPRQPPR